VLDLVQVRTGVLHCTGDMVFPLAHGRYVADHIRGATFTEIDGTDHFPFAENGDRFADELEEFITGRRSGTDSHRRLATVLFTDLADSTRHGSELGDRRWRDLLEAHDQMIGIHVERHRGELVKSTGDGCLALFNGPQAAIAAAETIRTTASGLGLQIYAGIHTGEVEQRQEDIAGLAVHIAARVVSAAAPGEILVTRTVRDLVTGSDLEFADRGSHTLKGFDEAWNLFAVC
jgi:class 3 adenylate cyclase